MTGTSTIDFIARAWWLACTVAICAAWAVGVGANRVAAAEIHLHSDCVAEGGMVRLGDLAEITAGSEEQRAVLADVELFPAPATAQERFLSQSELVDLLRLRGVELASHRFSGASRVRLAAAVRPKRPSVVRVSAREQRQAVEEVERLLLAYLAEVTQVEEGWRLRVTVTPEHARAINEASGRLRVTRGPSDYSGTQEFTLTTGAARGGELRVSAEISMPELVVVVARPLNRGAIIQPDDVRLERRLADARVDEPLTSLDQVIGKETTRTVVANQILDSTALRNPLLVRRGEPITVYAVSPGVRVRTVATAREDGGMGDVISVESRQHRQPLLVRVSGYQVGEIYARATSLPSEPANASSEGRSKAARVAAAEPVGSQNNPLR